MYATNPHTTEELKASTSYQIDCILEIELIHVNAHFLKRCQKCVDEGGEHFHVIRLLCNVTQLSGPVEKRHMPHVYRFSLKSSENA